MKIYSLLQIGEFHTNNCEDFLIIEQIATHQKVIAVFDGCTMGTESVFAAILYGKCLRKISKNSFYLDFIQPQDIGLKERLKSIVNQLFTELQSIKNKLGLNTHELLSTLVIGIIDEKNLTAEFLTIGDGLICHDGQLIEYEQGDKPNYLGYHLGKEFQDWFSSLNQTYSINKFRDLSISTDGIFTFKNLEKSGIQKPEREIVNYLLIDTEYMQFDNCLTRKLRFLNKQLNHSVTDDLAIIRVKASNK